MMTADGLLIPCFRCCGTGSDAFGIECPDCGGTGKIITHDGKAILGLIAFALKVGDLTLPAPDPDAPIPFEVVETMR
jgi:hypothetical protein